MKPSSRLAVLALLLVAGSLAAARAPAQGVHREGFQAETSFRATTLLGGAYPHSETGLGVQAALRRVWPSGVSVALGGTYSQPEDLSLPNDDPRKYMEEFGPYAEVRYQIPDSRIVTPYMGVRVGWQTLRAEHISEASGSGLAGGLVAGTEIWATERFGFRLNAAASAFRAPGLVEGFSNSGQAWSVEAGVTYFFGRSSHDSDGDGVDDGRDACPDTPRGAQVDASGCLPDGDGDGTPDLRDACPETPEGVEVDERGCARDGDADGVPNSLDQCAGTPAGQPVDEEGCIADADGDGVADSLDACPDTPSGTGVDARGCSRDADGDGVPDGRDRCPETLRAAEVDEAGCSDVQEGLRQGRLTVTGLPFRFRDVQVNMDLAGHLEQMGRELRRNQDLSLEIRVYTDTIGPTSYNQQMSQRLAEAARDFLLRNYPELARARLEAVGMGETDPQSAESEDGGRVVFIVRDRGQGGSSP